MKDSENDLLISAYLDGELTAEERAHVEQLLTTSGAARQLLEEMRALRAGLQDLPQHRLEMDFAQHVLRKAEQALSEQPVATEHASGDVDSSNRSHLSPLSPHPASRLPIRLPLSRRGIAWSLVAVAAAVVIMVTTKSTDQIRQGGQHLDERSVARAPAAIEQQHLAIDRAKNVPLSGAAPAQKEVQPGFNVTAANRATESLSDVSNSAPSGNGMLVVRANMSAEAAHNGAFDQLLAKNHIALVEEKSKLDAESRDKFDAGKLGDGKQFGLASTGESGVDVVYVEAAPKQIEATLADLRKDPQMFSSVNVADEQQRTPWENKVALSLSSDAVSGVAQKGGLPKDANSSDLVGMLKKQIDQPMNSSPALSRARRLSLPAQTVGQVSTDAAAASGEIVANEKKTPIRDRAIGGSGINGEANGAGLGGGGFGGGIDGDRSAGGQLGIPVQSLAKKSLSAPAAAAPRQAPATAPDAEPAFQPPIATSPLPAPVAAPTAATAAPPSSTAGRAFSPAISPSVDASAVNAVNSSALSAPQQALFVLRIVDAPTGSNSAKPSSVLAVPPLSTKLPSTQLPSTPPPAPPLKVEN
jgi:anti-sigma factor RsiW